MVHNIQNSEDPGMFASLHSGVIMTGTSRTKSGANGDLICGVSLIAIAETKSIDLHVAGSAVLYMFACIIYMVSSKQRHTV